MNNILPVLGMCGARETPLRGIFPAAAQEIRANVILTGRESSIVNCLK